MSDPGYVPDGLHVLPIIILLTMCFVTNDDHYHTFPVEWFCIHLKLLHIQCLIQDFFLKWGGREMCWCFTIGQGQLHTFNKRCKF